MADIAEPGRIHQVGAPSSRAAALMPLWLLFAFCEATPPFAVVYWKLKFPPEWKKLEASWAVASSMSA